MRGFDIKQIPMRSFQISGLTAKWGIGDSRKTPIWGANLIGRWDARTFPDGALATIPNTATMADKAPDLTVTGATMVSGTLLFDGVDDGAITSTFSFPERYTVFWDIDWLGSENKMTGIAHPENLYLYNFASSGSILSIIKNTSGGHNIPNTNVGVSTNGNIYAPDGSITLFGGTIGTKMNAGPLFISKKGAAVTPMGFRQLLIFNKELSQDEVNDVLSVMFPA